MYILFAVMFFDFSWVPTDDTKQVALYKDSVQIGVFKIPEMQYLRLDEKGEFVKDETPTPIPEVYLNLWPLKRVDNYGIDLSEMRNKQGGYYHNGRAITKESALLLMGTSGIPDDSELLRVTIIGPESVRRQIREDMTTDPSLKQFKELVVVQDYPVNHWAVNEMGFELYGDVAIYVQHPDGTVLHKQNDYKDGPTGLAAALRKADQNYRKGGDPDLRSPLEGSLLVLICIITLVLAVFFFKRSDV